MEPSSLYCPNGCGPIYPDSPIAESNPFVPAIPFKYGDPLPKGYVVTWFHTGGEDVIVCVPFLWLISIKPFNEDESESN